MKFRQIQRFFQRDSFYLPRWGFLSLSILQAAVLFVLIFTFARHSTAVDWQEKVAPALLVMMNGDGVDRVEFLIELEAQGDLAAVDSSWTKTQKGSYVFTQLQIAAFESQDGLLRELRLAGVEHKPFWVTNAIWVSAPPHLIPSLAQRPDVRYLHTNLPIPQADPLPVPEADAQAVQANEWGLEKIGADLLWAEGITGTGALIGGQDTGYQWDHPALIDAYRGWDPISQTADHNYGWHDAISSDLSGNGTNNRCGYSSPVPCDDYGHGTHTMGTMIGTTGGNGNQIGVAPGADWISCRNMEEGWGTPATYIDCFEWFLAPTDLAGLNPDPSKAPHVINNSWACPTSEGCNTGNFAIMEQVVDNLRTAGIAVVVSAGNYGPACSTVRTPAAIFDSSIAIGATSQSDGIASFSSRGPVTVDGSGRLKPDLVAPGVGVYSAYLDDGYSTLQGTSMAAPHVAGAIGLLISAVPQAAGQVDLLEQALIETATPLTTAGSCGGVSNGSVPNHVFGAGRINVAAARDWLTVELGSQLTTTVSGPLFITENSPTIPLQTNLTYTLHVTALATTQDVTLTANIPTNTTLLTTTLPVSITGSQLSWSWSQLSPTTTQQVTLTLQLSDTTPSTIFTVSFDDYAVKRQGFLTPTFGLPITTTILHAPYKQHLPIVLNN